MSVHQYQFCRPIKKQIDASGGPISACSAILSAYLELPENMRRAAVLTVDTDYDTGRVVAVNVCGVRRATPSEAASMWIGDAIYLAGARLRAAIAKAEGR